MNAFLRFDALLGLYLNIEGRLTISYDELKAEMKEYDCDVGFNIRRWKWMLRQAEPPLENVTELLSDRLFLDSFFPHATTKCLRRMAFETDNAKMLKLFLGDRVKNMFRNACRLGKKEIVKMLLEDGRADPKAGNNYAIKMAAKNGCHSVVKLLLEDGRADPAARDNQIIRVASRHGHTEVVKLLLEDGRADPAAQNNSVIQMAAHFGYVAIVKMLLKDRRIDPTANNNYAIKIASSSGHTEVVEMLLKDGRADLTTGINYPIKVASENGHGAVIKLLLGDGRIDPMTIESYAMIEALYGRPELLRLILFRR